MCGSGGAPAITGDRKHSFFSSSYSDDFQYRQCAPPQPAEKVEFPGNVNGEYFKMLS